MKVLGESSDYFIQGLYGKLGILRWSIYNNEEYVKHTPSHDQGYVFDIEILNFFSKIAFISYDHKQYITVLDLSLMKDKVKKYSNNQRSKSFVKYMDYQKSLILSSVDGYLRAVDYMDEFKLENQYTFTNKKIRGTEIFEWSNFLAVLTTESLEIIKYDGESSFYFKGGFSYVRGWGVKNTVSEDDFMKYSQYHGHLVLSLDLSLFIFKPYYYSDDSSDRNHPACSVSSNFNMPKWSFTNVDCPRCSNAVKVGDKCSFLKEKDVLEYENLGGMFEEIYKNGDKPNEEPEKEEEENDNEEFSQEEPASFSDMFIEEEDTSNKPSITDEEENSRIMLIVGSIVVFLLLIVLGFVIRHFFCRQKIESPGRRSNRFRNFSGRQAQENNRPQIAFRGGIQETRSLRPRVPSLAVVRHPIGTGAMRQGAPPLAAVHRPPLAAVHRPMGTREYPLPPMQVEPEKEGNIPHAVGIRIGLPVHTSDIPMEVRDRYQEPVLEGRRSGDDEAQLPEIKNVDVQRNNESEGNKGELSKVQVNF